jgi:acetyl/propionyl-CoA carboxylase alpha subunit
VEPGSEISIYYDPLISKLVAWGATRAEAIARMTRALSEYEVSGVRTSLPFFRWMLREPAFALGEFHTGYLDELLQSRRGEPFETPNLSDAEVAAIAVALGRRRRPIRYRWPRRQGRPTGGPTYGQARRGPVEGDGPPRRLADEI